MSFLELAKDRYSVRSFSNRPIEDEKLNKILEAGQIAPTAANNQPQHVYVIRSQDGMNKIRSLTKCHYGAPLVLLVAYDKSLEWKNPLQDGVRSGQQDASIIATHMMLEAWELGIGSCWVNMFAPDEAAKAFGLPENIVPILMLPLGYATDDAKPAAWHTQNKAISDTVEEL